MDIAHFDLETFKTFHSNKNESDLKFKLLDDTKIISIAKHLCGGATDLALYSLKL